MLQKVLEHLVLPCVLVPCVWTCRTPKKNSIAANTKSIRSLRDEEEIREIERRLSAEKTAELQSPEPVDRWKGSKEKAESQLQSPESVEKSRGSKEKAELSA
ncbi:unnamed protein product [Cylicocyclus nassatus]|uniref:Uncharacterized protein n=1 Tax=Cylicocyclus nassatus TaxID=53992 RepID=A0AA36H515_CYLNA|nr:unnamed protein product [Cylicocyclus nassatus]